MSKKQVVRWWYSWQHSFTIYLYLKTVTFDNSKVLFLCCEEIFYVMFKLKTYCAILPLLCHTSIQEMNNHYHKFYQSTTVRMLWNIKSIFTSLERSSLSMKMSMSMKKHSSSFLFIDQRNLFIKDNYAWMFLFSFDNGKFLFY